ETTTYTVLIVSENCITTRQVQIAVDENNAIDNDSLIVINIYPNPAKAGSEIKLNKHIRDACITIHDIAGNILYRNNIFSGSVLNIAAYIKPGIYILQIIEASHIQLIKLNIE
ncbi:MAG TPA: T9SS type A sorting domain-containing protein, partial [Bacteroidales bacterium]|nr:T9SS type A sorting domain-containing protein [Bacteroidales bacterium]